MIEVAAIATALGAAVGAAARHFGPALMNGKHEHPIREFARESREHYIRVETTLERIATLLEAPRRRK